MTFHRSLASIVKRHLELPWPLKTGRLPIRVVLSSALRTKLSSAYTSKLPGGTHGRLHMSGAKMACSLILSKWCRMVSVLPGVFFPPTPGITNTQKAGTRWGTIVSTKKVESISRFRFVSVTSKLVTRKWLEFNCSETLSCGWRPCRCDEIISGSVVTAILEAGTCKLQKKLA